MKNFRWAICAFIVALTFLPMQALGGATVEKIRFPYSPMSWNSLWWIAKEAGHFDRNGLDVDLFYEGASSVIVQTMLAGRSEFSRLGRTVGGFKCAQRRRRDPDRWIR